MERLRIEELPNYINNSYLPYIPMKINGKLNENYWYDLNLEFSELIYKEGINLPCFSDYGGFLHDFSTNIEGIGRTLNQGSINSIQFKDEVDSSKKNSIKVRYNKALNEFEEYLNHLNDQSYSIKLIGLKNKEAANEIKVFADIMLLRLYEFLNQLGLQFKGLEYFKIELKQIESIPKKNDQLPTKKIPSFKDTFESEEVYKKVMSCIPVELLTDEKGRYQWKKYKNGYLNEKLMMGAFLTTTEPIRKKYTTDKELIEAVSKHFNFLYANDNYSKFKKAASRQHCLDYFYLLNKYVESITVKK